MHVAEHRRALFLLALSLTGACAEDDLAGSLSRGECSPEGKCAAGYDCNAQKECVPSADGSAGSGGGGPDAKSDAPCANCPTGFSCCSDVCVDKGSDPAHCGSCSEVCPGTTCQTGTCTNECQAGLANCNKNVLDGCEAPATQCLPDAGTD